MNSSPRLRQRVKDTEKLVLDAYPDPKTGGAPWTAGWGSTGHGIGPGTTLTLDEAEDYFLLDIQAAENEVNKYVTVALDQGQFDALTSIFYNVGPGGPKRDGIGRLKNGNPSTLMRKLNAGDYKGARAEFFKWISPGSNVERGLRIRREWEVREFWDA